jgi:PHP family Zn ribbon phosphoesterase
MPSCIARSRFIVVKLLYTYARARSQNAKLMAFVKGVKAKSLKKIHPMVILPTLRQYNKIMKIVYTRTKNRVSLRVGIYIYSSRLQPENQVIVKKVESLVTGSL